MTKKNEKISSRSASITDEMTDLLKTACEGLIYISETDSEIVPFIADKIKDTSHDGILQFCNADRSSVIEVIDEAGFFRRLTEHKDWFGQREAARADRFLKLQQTLRSYLTDIKVFRVGSVRIEIIVAGFDKSGRVAGVRTFAVET